MPWFLLSQSATKTWTTRNARGLRLGPPMVAERVSASESAGFAAKATGDGDAARAARGTAGAWDAGAWLGPQLMNAQVSTPTQRPARGDDLCTTFGRVSSSDDLFPCARPLTPQPSRVKAPATFSCLCRSGISGLLGGVGGWGN